MKSEENIALIKQELSDFKIDLGSIKELLDVKVTTAKKLTVDEYQSISAILTEKLGRDIFLNKNVDPSILGGIIVQIGDKVYDASALRKLKKMEVVMNGIDVHDYALEKPEAMTDALSEKLENYNVDVNLEEVGIVEKIGDGIATVIGMKNAMAGELVELPNNVSGMVLNLNPDSVGIVLMGGETLIKEGDLVRRTGNIMDVPVGEALLGRVVSAIGAPIDGKGEIAYAEKRPVESPAHGIADRESVDTPLQTGIKCIDALVPIGRGQRELIIGDRGTGKTAVATNIKKMYGDELEKLQWSKDDPGIYQLSYAGVNQKTLTTGGTCQIQWAALKENDYKYPKTIDEYEKMIKSYLAAHPKTEDGLDMIGITMSAADWHWLITLSNPAGFIADAAPDNGQWLIDDDYTVHLKTVTPEEKEYFRWLCRMYNEGILDPNFATQTDDDYIAKVASGRVVALTDSEWHYSQCETALMADGKVGLQSSFVSGNNGRIWNGNYKKL